MSCRQHVHVGPPQLFALLHTYFLRLSLRFRASVTTRNLSLVLTSLGTSSTSFGSRSRPHALECNRGILFSTSRLSLERLDDIWILLASSRKVLYRSELGSQSLAVLKRRRVFICRCRRRRGLLSSSNGKVKCERAKNKECLGGIGTLFFLHAPSFSQKQSRQSCAALVA